MKCGLDHRVMRDSLQMREKGWSGGTSQASRNAGNISRDEHHAWLQTAFFVALSCNWPRIAGIFVMIALLSVLNFPVFSGPTTSPGPDAGPPPARKNRRGPARRRVLS